MLGIHTPTPILYLSFLSCVQAPPNVWSWVFLLSFRRQQILLELGISISSLLQDVSSNTFVRQTSQWHHSFNRSAVWLGFAFHPSLDEQVSGSIFQRMSSLAATFLQQTRSSVITFLQRMSSSELIPI
jgi:hypothetical protein